MDLRKVMKKRNFIENLGALFLLPLAGLEANLSCKWLKKSEKHLE